MNIIEGPEKQIGPVDVQEMEMRFRAWHMAVEQVRSAGPSHSPRLTIEEFMPIVIRAHEFLKTGK